MRTLYDRGYADAIAGRDQDLHLVYHAQYRRGYQVGLRARANREEMTERRHAA